MFIGPTSGPSARAWAASARQTIATVRRRPDLGVPDDVVRAFEHYLALWADGMAGEEFAWSGEIDPNVLRHLAAHWARLAMLARERPEQSGLHAAEPEGEEFFEALSAGIADALSRADDVECFAPKFEEVVPAFFRKPPDAAAGPAVCRVLLVDDNADIRLLVRMGLESTEGFEVFGEAADGREALDAVDADCPDAILLDLAMPVMDGFEALPLLRARCPRSRVVVFSASDTRATRARVSLAGSSDFLPKGATIAEVVASLRSVARLPQPSRE